MIKRGFLCFLRLVAAVLLTLAVWVASTLVIRAIPDVSGTAKEFLICGIVSVLAECVIFYILFIWDFYNNKEDKLKEPMLSLGFAFVLQFALALPFQFAPYISGAAVSNFGRYFFWRLREPIDNTITSGEMPKLGFILPLLILDILLAVVYFLAFISAKKKRESERIRKDI